MSLILNGKVWSCYQLSDVQMCSPPATVSISANRAFKYLARPYEEFALCVGKSSALLDCLRTHEAVFIEDKNLGLILQTMERMEMRQITALKETYLAISLEDVARKVLGSRANSTPTPDDIQRVEGLILRMVWLWPSCYLQVDRRRNPERNYI